MGDNPQEYENLTPEEKDAVQYWISKAVVPAQTWLDYTSYALKHDYQQESMQYTTNGQFKGAMLAAGYQPCDRDAQNWIFFISSRYDPAVGLLTFRINADGKPDMGLARHAAQIRRAREKARVTTSIPKDGMHTHQGELIYPTVPYTYESLTAAFQALSSVDALKAVKRVVDKEPLYTKGADGTRNWLVPSTVVDTLVKADILESTNGKYHLHKHLSAEASKIIFDWLGHSKELGIPPREPATPAS